MVRTTTSTSHHTPPPCFRRPQNPDPKAAAYFASHISKAYKALTDEVSRMNYEKYGHPDGPQGMNMGVALPSWMFNKDRKTAPLLLLGLVGGFILLPLAVTSYYMLKGDHYSGPNRIHNATLYAYAATKYGIKESQVAGALLGGSRAWGAGGPGGLEGWGA
jgi:translocation protein SEC63